MKHRSDRLDEVEKAHGPVGGSARGRRYASQQISQAYAVLLCSQFQGFCRDLHSETVDHLVSSVEPAGLRILLQAEFTFARKLDSGNPNPGNIGSDFNRLGLDFWGEMKTRDSRTDERIRSLIQFTDWRNAIAHQDFDPAKLGGTTVLRLAQVRAWRRMCNGLARSFNAVLAAHINGLLGNRPW